MLRDYGKTIELIENFIQKEDTDKLKNFLQASEYITSVIECLNSVFGRPSQPLVKNQIRPKLYFDTFPITP